MVVVNIVVATNSGSCGVNSNVELSSSVGKVMAWSAAAEVLVME